MNWFQGNIFFSPFFLLLFYSPINGGGGHGPPSMHLSYSSNSGAAKICQRGAVRGSEATERGEGAHGREIFKICV